MFSVQVALGSIKYFFQESTLSNNLNSMQQALGTQETSQSASSSSDGELKCQ